MTRKRNNKKKKNWLPLPYAYIFTMYHVSVETVVMFPIVLSIRNIVRERYLLPENVPKYSVLLEKSIEESKESKEYKKNREKLTSDKIYDRIFDSDFVIFFVTYTRLTLQLKTTDFYFST